MYDKYEAVDFIMKQPMPIQIAYCITCFLLHSTVRTLLLKVCYEIAMLSSYLLANASVWLLGTRG
jgi:hypothetical protein